MWPSDSAACRRAAGVPLRGTRGRVPDARPSIRPAATLPGRLRLLRVCPKRHEDKPSSELLSFFPPTPHIYARRQTGKQRCERGWGKEKKEVEDVVIYVLTCSASFTLFSRASPVPGPKPTCRRQDLPPIHPQVICSTHVVDHRRARFQLRYAAPDVLVRACSGWMYRHIHRLERLQKQLCLPSSTANIPEKLAEPPVNSPFSAAQARAGILVGLSPPAARRRLRPSKRASEWILPSLPGKGSAHTGAGKVAWRPLSGGQLFRILLLARCRMY